MVTFIIIMFGYEDELQGEIKGIKTEIENLIQHQKTSIEEITEQLNNLTALQKTKLDLDDKVLVSKAIVELEVEINMRYIFIHELEALL